MNGTKRTVQLYDDKGRAIEVRRMCGPCTACCKTHGIDEADLKTGAGEWCPHADPGKGCKIYTARPDVCQGFACWWLDGQDPELRDSDRPDRLGVVIDACFVADEAVPRFWQLKESAFLKARVKFLIARYAAKVPVILLWPKEQRYKVRFPTASHRYKWLGDEKGRAIIDGNVDFFSM